MLWTVLVWIPLFYYLGWKKPTIKLGWRRFWMFLFWWAVVGLVVQLFSLVLLFSELDASEVQSVAPAIAPTVAPTTQPYQPLTDKAMEEFFAKVDTIIESDNCGDDRECTSGIFRRLSLVRVPPNCPVCSEFGEITTCLHTSLDGLIYAEDEEAFDRWEIIFNQCTDDMDDFLERYEHL